MRSRLRIFSHTALRTIFLIVLVAFGSLIASWILSYAEGGAVDLEVDAFISQGKAFEVYCNGDFEHAFMEPVVQGRRHVYVFRGIPGLLRSLRLDPTEEAKATVSIFAITFKQGDHVLKSITSEELSKWGTVHASAAAPVNGSLLQLVTDYDPIIVTQEEIALTSHLLGLSPTSFVQTFIFPALLAMIGLYSLLGTSRGGILGFLVALLVVLLGLVTFQYLVSLVLGFGGAVPKVSQAVGYCSFHGIQKGGEFNAFRTAFGGVLMLALGGGFLWRWFRQRSLPSVVPSYSPDPIPYLFFLGMLVFLGVLSFPDLQALSNHFTHHIHRADYDSLNFLSWHYALFRGEFPLHDVWYPYGGFYFLGYGGVVPSIGASLLHWLHGLVVIGVLLFCLIQILEHRKGWVIGVMGTLVFLHMMGVIEAEERYFLSITVVLLWSVVLQRSIRSLGVLFGLYAFYVSVMESAQLIYAAAPCAFLFAFQFFRERDRAARIRLLAALIPGIGLFALLVIAFLALLYRFHALEEYLRLYTQVGAIADFSAVPSGVESWLDFPISIRGWSTILLIGLTMLSLWYWIGTLRLGGSVYDAVPVVLSLVSVAIFQKQLLRPHMGYQLFAPLLIGFAVLGFRYGRAWTFRTHALSFSWLALSAGLVFHLVSVGAHIGGLEQVPREVVHHMRKFGESVRYLWTAQQTWPDLAQRYYAASSIMVGRASGTSIRDELLRSMDLRDGQSVYVLGDDSFLYMLLGMRIPFHTSLYPQSPLLTQMGTVQSLREHQPAYVLWRDSFREFDGVPNVVRTPLLYQYVVENYSFKDRIGEFSVLRKLRQDEQPDLSFWRAALGETTDLGFIPSRSEVGDLPPVADGHPLPILSITIRTPVHNTVRDIAVQIDDQMYYLRFREREGIHRYFINLRRVWFWQEATRQSKKPLLLTRSTDQMVLKHRLKRVGAQVLY